jgi:16S rRNA (guanine527-N7)-methyltransferase
VPFEDELARVLPNDIPNRTRLITLAAKHLAAVEETNRVMNLTRIISPPEAAIKHVFDSVYPWRRFAEAEIVLDAGTGAGFPGLPLAIALPDVKFVLAESVHKRARFVDAVVEDLHLPNVQVLPARAEEVLQSKPVQMITARAVAPLSRAIPLFARALKRGATALLYKGPDAEEEIMEARVEIDKRRLRARVVERYELPDRFGERTLVELRRA